jgi:ribosomal protein S18 acetylase RimI-like enzyme
MRLRSVTYDDVPRLAELLDQLGYPTDDDAVAERLRYWLGDPASALIGAEVDRELIGIVALHVCPILEATGRFGRIVALVVDNRCRGRAVGKALIAAAEAQARAAGCISMEVTSNRARVPAHAFYRRLGYEDACHRSARFIKFLGDG